MKTLIFWVEKNKTFSRAFRGQRKRVTIKRVWRSESLNIFAKRVVFRRVYRVLGEGL